MMALLQDVADGGNGLPQAGLDFRRKVVEGRRNLFSHDQRVP